MGFKITKAAPLEPSSIRSRQSFCRDIYEAAKKTTTKTVTVQGDTEAELNSLYKSLIQWRKRHQYDMPCTVNKDGHLIYVTAGRYEHPRDAEKAPGNKPPKQAIESSPSGIVPESPE